MRVEDAHDDKQQRGEAVVRRVLAATIEEVALTGYDGLTLERVAARAGVNRTTIYRRWPTKKELVAATMRFASERVVFDWDRGSLRADLAELLERAREVFFTPGMVGLQRLMIEAQRDPELSVIACTARDGHAARAFAMLERAEKRGELRPDLDKELFLDGMFGALFSHVVLKHETITPEFAKRLLDHLVKVAAPANAKAKVSRATRPKTTGAKAKTNGARPARARG